jgi:uncharacterized protein involved in exopolysaccharide biosynthesis
MNTTSESTETESNAVPAVPTAGAEEEIYLLDYLVILAQRKWLIARVTLACMVVAAIVSLFLSNIYTGEVKLMPPRQGQSVTSLLAAQLGPFAGLASERLGFQNPSDIYVEMLRSRTVADGMVQRLDLLKHYKTTRMLDARQELVNASSFSADVNGVITIDVDDKDPNFAAALANGYVEEIQRLSQTLAISEAAQRRAFFEKEFRNAREQLSDAELALKKVQETTGLIQLDSQTKALIEGVANLKAQIAATEVKLGTMRSFATKQNPDLIRTENELGALRGQLASIQRTTGSSAELGVSTGKVPEVGLEYVRKLRDVKYYEALTAILANQYQAAKLDESKEAAIIQILDKAVVPEKKSKPKRSSIVLVFGLLGAFGAMVWVLGKAANERAMANPEHSARMHLLKQYLWSDMRFRFWR